MRPPEVGGGCSGGLCYFAVVVLLFGTSSAAVRGEASCPTAEELSQWNAGNKAYHSPIVFKGRLVGSKEDADGNVLARFRVQKVLKEKTVVLVNAPRKQEVVVALLKNYLPRTVSRTGRRHRRLAACPVPVDQLKRNERYLVYAAPLVGYVARALPEANFSATAPPDVFTKKSSQEIRKASCENCGKPAVAKGQEGRMNFKENHKLKLECKLKGIPIPWVQWFFNGKLLTPSSPKRIRIKTRGRLSVLVIRKAKREDSGTYECRARNNLQKEPSSFRTQVLVDPQVPECPNKNFCLNGGTCTFLRSIGEQVCHCLEGYRGQRCDYKDTGPLKSLEGKNYNKSTFVVILGTIVFFIVLFTGFFLVWLKNRRQRKKVKGRGDGKPDGQSSLEDNSTNAEDLERTQGLTQENVCASSTTSFSGTRDLPNGGRFRKEFQHPDEKRSLLAKQNGFLKQQPIDSSRHCEDRLVKAHSPSEVCNVHQEHCECGKHEVIKITDEELLEDEMLKNTAHIVQFAFTLVRT